MTADKLETFIGQIMSGEAYTSNPDLQAMIDFEIDAIRGNIDASNAVGARQAMLRITQLIKGARAETVTTVPGGDLDAVPTVDEAKDYMESRCGPGYFYGPMAVMKAFGGSGEAPPLPPWKEIEAHAAKKHVLRLRLDQNGPGAPPCTVNNMSGFLDGVFEDLDARGLDLLMKGDLPNGKPRSGWAFTSSGVLPDSNDMTYQKQTSVLANYIETRLYDGKDVPASIAEYIRRWDKWREDAMEDGTYDYNDESFVWSLVRADLNTICRPSLAEMIFDFLIERASGSLQKERWQGATLTSTMHEKAAICVDNWGEDDDIISFKTFSPGQSSFDIGCHLSYTYLTS